MKKRLDEYAAFPKAMLAYAFPEMIGDVAAGQRIKKIVGAVVERRRGLDTLSDAALDYEAAFFKQRRDAALAKWRKAHPGEPYPFDDDGGDDDGPKGGGGGGKKNAAHGKSDAADRDSDAAHGKSDAPTVRQSAETERQSDSQPKPKAETPSTPLPPAAGEAWWTVAATPGTAQAWQFSGDKSQIQSRTIGDSIGTLVTPGPSKSGPRDPVADALARIRAGNREAIWNAGAVPNAILPELAAAYCGERRNERAVGIYGTACKKAGYQVFREELAAFISECESGEEPGNRGKAFMTRAMKLQGTAVTA